MFDIILDNLIDTIKMLPFILVIFILSELFEHRFGENFKPFLNRSRYAGPIIGAAVGTLPQCGFSVMATLLYAEGTITTGTLISVYVATSDEAIPIILSNPGRANVIPPLIVTGFIAAIIVGYSVDAVIPLLRKKQTAEESPRPIDEDVYQDSGCCGHRCLERNVKVLEMVKHALSHTFRILFYVFIVSSLLGLSLFYLGKERLGELFLGKSVFQPVLTALIGLIPNCAASVALTELFLNGQISFGSAIAGLSASGGLGLIVLFKEVKPKKKALLVILLLFSLSILVGVILNGVLPANFLQSR